jgi:hypothetical protein
VIRFKSNPEKEKVTPTESNDPAPMQSKLWRRIRLEWEVEVSVYIYSWDSDYQLLLFSWLYILFCEQFCSLMFNLTLINHTRLLLIVAFTNTRYQSNSILKQLQKAEARIIQSNKITNDKFPKSWTVASNCVITHQHWTSKIDEKQISRNHSDIRLVPSEVKTTT